MIIKFFHTPKPRKFKYNPHYYDERKEELNRLKKEYGIIKDDGSEDYRARLRQKIESNWRRRRVTSSRERSSSIRLVLILAALMLLAYWFFYK